MFIWIKLFLKDKRFHIDIQFSFHHTCITGHESIKSLSDPISDSMLYIENQICIMITILDTFPILEKI